MTNKLRPIHPGEILANELEELNISANSFAKALQVPANRITAILNQHRSITADTALRLEQYFGTRAEFWLNLQMIYDLKVAEMSLGKKIRKEVHKRDAA